MIVVYTQDGTYISNDADTAKDVFVSVYGEKLGTEAYTAIKDARPGASYRRHGGPLVRVVTEEQAAKIREKEAAVGRL